jgi:4-aminobutyrate aminotransferase-like enzyme
VNKPHRTSGEIAPLDREALESFWLPFTPNRQFKADPRLFVAAEGMHYVTSDGGAFSTPWRVVVRQRRHGQRAIVDAIKAQAERLDFVSSFQMSHPAAFELAGRIAEIAPPGLDHVFFTNSGSEAVDTALKIARAYHRARGEGRASGSSAAPRPTMVWAGADFRSADSDVIAAISGRCCRRSTIYRTRTASNTRHSRAASRNGARIWPTN